MNVAAEKPRPLLTVRPVFDQFQTVLESVPMTLLGVTASALLGGTFFWILLSVAGLEKMFSVSGIYGAFFVLGLAALPPLFYEMKRHAYQRTVYCFYGDYLEFQDFLLFFKRRRGRVRYSDIADVSQRADQIQDRQKLQTIYLFVPSMGYQSRGPFSGIKMSDIRANAGIAERVMDFVYGRAPSLTETVKPPPVAEAASSP